MKYDASFRNLETSRMQIKNEHALFTSTVFNLIWILMSHIQLISVRTMKKKRLLKVFSRKTTLTSTKEVLKYENLQFRLRSSFPDVAAFVNSPVIRSKQHFSYLSLYSLKSYTHECYYCDTFQCLVQSQNAFLAALLRYLNTFCSLRIYSVTTVIYRKGRQCHYQPVKQNMRRKDDC
jgi:hypothetical protein